MSDNRTSSTSLAGAGIASLFVGLILGLVIGLPILGWWLWPVQWTGGNMEIATPAIQQDFLRASIDSYSVNSDVALASQRYYSLGKFKETTLSAIAQNPGAIPPDSIESFAKAVGAESVLTNPPRQPVPAPTRANIARWISLLCGLLVVAALAIALLVIWLRSRKPKAPPPAYPPVPTEQAPTEAEVAPDAAVDETLPAEAETQPAEIPDWLQEAAPQPPAAEPSTTEEWGLGGAAVAAAAAGGAVVGAAMLSDDKPAEAEPTTETESVADFQAVASEEEDLSRLEPDRGSGVPVATAVGLAAAAAALGSDQPQAEEPVAEEAVSEEPAVEEPMVEEPAAQEPVRDTADETLVDAAAVTAAAAALRDDPGEDETPEETYRKFGREIEFVEGIGPVYGERLRSIGITTPLLLLRNGATPKDRKEIAEKSGISEKLVLRWINHVDLFRIKGVSHEYAELLEVSGVDTVVELSRRNPANLHAKMLEVNEERNLVRRPPALSSVQNWVEQAKQLPRVISY